MMEITGAEVEIAILGFLTLFLFVFGIYQYIRLYWTRKKILYKIKYVAESSIDESVPKGQGIREAWGKFTAFLASLGKRTVPPESKDYSRMNIKFLKAGIRHPNFPAIYWGIKCFLAIFFSAPFLLIQLTIPSTRIFNLNTTLAVCLFLAALGFYLPDIWINIRIHKRKNQIAEGLPDALDLLVICVEAGMGLDAAINRVAQELALSNKVLSDELKLLNLELRAGKSRDDALRDLAKRTGLEEVNSLVTLIIQANKFGTSIVQTLRVYSDTFRARRFQKAEEEAAKLPVKLIFPTILFIFPSLFVAILGPAIIRIYEILSSR